MHTRLLQRTYMNKGRCSLGLNAQTLKGVPTSMFGEHERCTAHGRSLARVR